MAPIFGFWLGLANRAGAELSLDLLYSMRFTNTNKTCYKVLISYPINISAFGISIFTPAIHAQPFCSFILVGKTVHNVHYSVQCSKYSVQWQRKYVIKYYS